MTEREKKLITEIMNLVESLGFVVDSVKYGDEIIEAEKPSEDKHPVFPNLEKIHLGLIITKFEGVIT